jgi:hypothetical protein
MTFNQYKSFLLGGRKSYSVAGEGAAGGGGGGGGTETMEVDLEDGVKVTVPKEQGAKIIAGRDARKAKMREQETKLGAIQAEKDAAEAKVRRAEEDRQAAEATKKGETDKAREILNKAHSEKLVKLAGQMAADKVKALVASYPKILPSIIDDATELLRGRVRYDVDAGSFIVLNEAGAPLTDDTGAQVGADAFIKSWLEKRPHFLRDATPSGSGAAKGGTTGTADAATITRAEYEEATKKPQNVALLRKVSKGLVKVVDPD